MPQGTDPLAWVSQDDPLSWLDDSAIETSIGRKQYTARNVADNVAKLRAIKPRDEEHKKRIEKLIASLESQSPAGRYTRPTTADAKPKFGKAGQKRDPRENVVR